MSLTIKKIPLRNLCTKSADTSEQILVSSCRVPGKEFHLQNVRRHTFLLFAEGQQPREGTDVTILPLIKILHCPISCCRHWRGSRTRCKRCCPRGPSYRKLWRDPRWPGTMLFSKNDYNSVFGRILIHDVTTHTWHMSTTSLQMSRCACWPLAAVREPSWGQGELEWGRNWFWIKSFSLKMIRTKWAYTSTSISNNRQRKYNVSAV